MSNRIVTLDDLKRASDAQAHLSKRSEAYEGNEYYAGGNDWKSVRETVLKTCHPKGPYSECELRLVRLQHPEEPMSGYFVAFRTPKGEWLTSRPTPVIGPHMSMYNRMRTMPATQIWQLFVKSEGDENRDHIEVSRGKYARHAVDLEFRAEPDDGADLDAIESGVAFWDKS